MCDFLGLETKRLLLTKLTLRAQLGILSRRTARRISLWHTTLLSVLRVVPDRKLVASRHRDRLCPADGANSSFICVHEQRRALRALLKGRHAIADTANGMEIVVDGCRRAH